MDLKGLFQMSIIGKQKPQNNGVSDRFCFHCSFIFRESKQYILSQVAFTQNLLQISYHITNLAWDVGIFFHSYLEAKEIVTAVFHISPWYICVSITVLSEFPFSRIQITKHDLRLHYTKKSSHRSHCIYTDAQPDVFLQNSTTEFSLGHQTYNLGGQEGTSVLREKNAERGRRKQYVNQGILN